MPARPVIIVGPTAGGKSELAVRLAEALGGQVLSADSMQVYRHLDAGTAKPPSRLRQRVAHHLLDIVEPTVPFTVADWLERAEACLENLRSQRVRPIVVGGTNLYLKALLEGLFEGPPADPRLRERLRQTPVQQLHAQLQAVDPAAAARIHPNDRKKLVRALEVFEATGKPISQWQTQWREESPAAGPESKASGGEPTYRHDPILIGLDWPVELINQRINLRVKAMFFPQTVDPALVEEICPRGESLPQEVRRLETGGLLGQQARQALGYKQVLEHLAGACTLDEAFEKTKILTRRFAKTQRTWLKRYRGVHWLPAHQSSAQQLAERALEVIAAADPRPC